MKVLRTPDSRFENLPGYPFAPRYAEVGGVRCTTSTRAREAGPWW